METVEQARFEKLFKDHYAALVAFVARTVGSTDAAEDLVQDVFVSIWRRRSEMDFDSIPRAYLYKAARHRALNSLRHDRVARGASPPPEPAFAPSAEDALLNDEIETAVRAAVAKLPDRARLMFTLSRYEGLTYAEIAEVTGVSIKTVETQMGRALRALRGYLAGLER